jgi:hypothetical protein
MPPASIDTVHLSLPNICSTVFEAISQTTSILETFILAMLHYPDVYCKAQEEIDRVIGYERLPELVDRDSLPYFEAVIMELYRCIVCNIQLILLF